MIDTSTEVTSEINMQRSISSEYKATVILRSESARSRRVQAMNIRGLIPRSLQLQARVTLASLS
jgi:hypothetical protein